MGFIPTLEEGIGIRKSVPSVDADVPRLHRCPSACLYCGW